jgi:hypothetical protein
MVWADGQNIEGGSIRGYRLEQDILLCANNYMSTRGVSILLYR